MLSQRIKCLNYLSARTEKQSIDTHSLTKKNSIDFLPFIQERDFHGNLIGPKILPRKEQRLIPHISPKNQQSLISCLYCFDNDSAKILNTDASTKIKTDTSVIPTSFRNDNSNSKGNLMIQQHFQVQLDGKYLNEHLTKKVSHKRLQNLLSYKSIQRQSQVPTFSHYNPNYEFNKKKSFNAIIFKQKETNSLEKIKSQSQPKINEQSTERQGNNIYGVKKTSNPIGEAFNRLMKQINSDVDQEQKAKYKVIQLQIQNPLDNLISDISQFQSQIQRTLEKSHVSKDRVIRKSKK